MYNKCTTLFGQLQPHKLLILLFKLSSRGSVYISYHYRKDMRRCAQPWEECFGQSLGGPKPVLQPVALAAQPLDTQCAGIAHSAFARLGPPLALPVGFLLVSESVPSLVSE